MTARPGGSVVLDHVSKSFDHGRIQALADVSARIDGGEVVALVGPSGCGKSTLLNLVGTLDEPDGGRIEVGDTDLSTVTDRNAYRARTIGFVFQFHNLMPTLTAEQNVQLPMWGQGMARRERRARARELLGAVGLSGRADSHPTTLSGGERQRVAIARALANEPLVVLADEPTGALDSDNAALVLGLLREISALRGTTVLIATNDEQAADAADRVLRLRAGRILEVAHS